MDVEGVARVGERDATGLERVVHGGRARRVGGGEPGPPHQEADVLRGREADDPTADERRPGERARDGEVERGVEPVAPAGGVGAEHAVTLDANPGEERTAAVDGEAEEALDGLAGDAADREDVAPVHLGADVGPAHVEREVEPGALPGGVADRGAAGEVGLPLVHDAQVGEREVDARAPAVRVGLAFTVRLVARAEVELEAAVAARPPDDQAAGDVARLEVDVQADGVRPLEHVLRADRDVHDLGRAVQAGLRRRATLAPQHDLAGGGLREQPAGRPVLGRPALLDDAVDERVDLRRTVGRADALRRRRAPAARRGPTRRAAPDRGAPRGDRARHAARAPSEDATAADAPATAFASASR